MSHTLGWQVTDPDGNVVDSGEVTVVVAEVAEEIAAYLDSMKEQ